MNIIKPAGLKTGDTIGILATAGAVEDKGNVLRAKNFFETRGYKVVLSENVFDRHCYLAGTDEKKIEEMLTALNGVSSAQVLLTVNEAPEKGARPSVRGVSVIYSGSDTSDIKLKITMLVSTAFGITSDKIYVTCK